MLKERIKAASEAFFEETKRNREHLHRYPELSHEESETVHFIEQKLREYGLVEIQKGELGIGVLALVRGKKTGRQSDVCVCLRADCDALPIRESSEAPYCSQREGKMHACAHDYHSASLLTAAKILQETRHEWSGIVKLLWQRGEERVHPTLKKSGALLALEHGLLNAPRPTVIFGQHATPEVPFGKVAFFPTGQIGSMAAADTISIEVLGDQGGHGARPFTGIDPMPAAAAILSGMQVLLTRRTDSNNPCILSVGKVQSIGGSANVLAKRVELEGTLRTFDPVFREKIIGELGQLVEHTAKSFGANANMKVLQNTIALTNTPQLNERVRAEAIEFLGVENVIEAERRTGGEDFCFYQTAEGMQTCFWRIGTGDPASGRYMSDLHKDNFDVHPESMRLSPGLLAWLAISELQATEATKFFQKYEREEECSPQVGTNDGGWAI